MQATSTSLARRAFLVVPVLVALTACGRTMRETTTGMPAAAADGWTDGSVAHVIHVVNNDEIEQGRLAVQRASSQRVRQFAQRMIDDHTNANQELMEVVSMDRMSQDATSTQVQQNSRTSIQNLQTFEGAEFDRAYIRNQIAMHRWTLNSLDQVLIPGADSQQLRNRLQNLRSTIASHLSEAEQIQQSLGR